MKRTEFSTFRIIAVGFGIVALIGTLLLMMPFSSQSGEWTPFNVALFTAVSSSCVTGLVLVDTATYWSFAGQIIILLLIQLGGLGFMSVATFFLSFTKKNINLKNRSIMAESINTEHISGLKLISRKILIGTALFEGVGAVILSLVFIRDFGLFKGIYYGIFHSVSAFCNGGFDLLGINGEFSSLTAYSDNIIVNLTLIILITVGGIGFLVWDDILKNKLCFRKYRLHTKLVLTTSAILIISGALLFFVLEYNNSLCEADLMEKLLVSVFSSVTCRTAGFNTIDFAFLSDSTIIIMCMLMFVGGSSGSTAGGIKTTTISVIAIDMISNLRGIKEAAVFGRKFRDNTHKKAVTVFTFSLCLIFIGSFLISAMHEIDFIDILFEVVSAVSTTGITTGITRELNNISQFILASLMYLGRVGSISFALAILEKRAQPKILFPSEAITVG